MKVVKEEIPREARKVHASLEQNESSPLNEILEHHPLNLPLQEEAHQRLDVA